MDLYMEIENKLALLNSAISEVKKRGRELAEAEREYRVELAKDILIKRADKFPVTIIGDICRGKEEIAELKLKRDISESLYKSVLEAINCYKLQIKIIENQLEREYGQAKRMWPLQCNK